MVIDTTKISKQKVDIEENVLVYNKYRWFVLFVACFSVASLYIHMTSIAPILGIIAEDINLDMGKASQLLTARMLGEAIWMPILGFVVDKYGLTKTIAIGHLIALTSVLVIPWFGNSYVGFLIVRFLQASSVGLIFPIIGYIAVNWFPKKEHGLANGVFFSGVSIGAALGGVLSPLLNKFINNWQITLAVLGILNVIGIVFALMLSGKRSPVQENVVGNKVYNIKNCMTYGEALKFPITWIGAAIVFANAWVFFGLTNFVPVFLAEAKPVGVGLGPVTAGYLYLALTLTGIIAVLFGGWFYDVIAKGRAKLMVAIGFVCGMFGFMLILPGIHTSIFLIVVVLIISGFGIPFQNPALSAYVIKIYPAEVSGQMMGWWYGVGTFGAAVGLFLGALSIGESGSFNWAIGDITLVSIIGFFLTIVFLKNNLKLEHHRT